MNRKKGPENGKERVADLIARFSQGLASGRMTIREAMEIFEDLRQLADESVPYILNMLASPDKDARSLALALLDEVGDQRAVAPLQRMLGSPDYDDYEKMSIIQTLDALGAPVDEATFNRVVSDPETVLRRSIELLVEQIDNPDQMEAILDEMAKIAPEVQEGYVKDILGPLANRRLLPLLIALLHSEHDGVVIAAVDALERLKDPTVIPLLEERARHDPSHRVRHAAENASLRLQAREGRPESPAQPGATDTVFPVHPWFAPSPFPLAQCRLSAIDGDGGQVLFTVYELSEGYLQVFGLMFNDHDGIKETLTAIVDEHELGGILGPIELVNISLEQARVEVARAYQTTLDAHHRLPPAFIVRQGWLEGEDPRTVEEFPLPTLDPAQRAPLLEGCTELLTLDEFEYWFFNPDEVEPFVPRYRELRRKGQARRNQAPFEALLDEAIAALVGEEHRRLLADRLRRQAWLLAQIYEEEVVPLWALAAADALENGIVVEHPLLRDMVDHSFLNAVGPG